VLIEQFGAAAINAPGGPWQIEIVAGLIDPGETPDDVVRREAMEEAGCSVDGVELIGEFLLSPGGSSDRMFLYCARIDSSDAGGIHGLIEEGENIRVFTMATDDAMAAISDGRIRNATCVIGLQWLALNRVRLRAAWQSSGTAAS
jgi:ADP-ribose pyrophosphatase